MRSNTKLHTNFIKLTDTKNPHISHKLMNTNIGNNRYSIQLTGLDITKASKSFFERMIIDTVREPYQSKWYISDRKPNRSAQTKLWKKTSDVELCGDATDSIKHGRLSHHCTRGRNALPQHSSKFVEGSHSWIKHYTLVISINWQIHRYKIRNKSRSIQLFQPQTPVFLLVMEELSNNITIQKRETKSIQFHRKTKKNHEIQTKSKHKSHK